MTDEELVELAETANVCRLYGGGGGLDDLVRVLADASSVLQEVPLLVEELREARRRLAERGEARPEW